MRKHPARNVSAAFMRRRVIARKPHNKFERRAQTGILARRKVCARGARARRRVHVGPTARPKPKRGRQLGKVRIEKCGEL
jgi:hypothetical protein